ncbi:MAG TPA: GlsB/YeaQ/YmgE family stress response membrane protein [Rhodanobacter sp.]
MNLIIWLVVGGLIGWLASVLMNTDARQGIIENIIVGIAGAFIGGLFIGRLIGVGTINQQNFSLPSLLLSLLGAVILLAIFKLLRRQWAR